MFHWPVGSKSLSPRDKKSAIKNLWNLCSNNWYYNTEWKIYLNLRHFYDLDNKAVDQKAIGKMGTEEEWWIL